MKRLNHSKMANVVGAALSLILALGLNCTSASANFQVSGPPVQGTAVNAFNNADIMVALYQSGTEHEHEHDNDEGKGDDDDKGNVPVPEPGAILLLSTGLFGLAVYSRRRGEKGEALHK
jgi:hypothetical protein